MLAIFRMERAVDRPLLQEIVNGEKKNNVTEVKTTQSLSINQELLNDPNAPETREIYKQLIKLNFSVH